MRANKNKQRLWTLSYHGTELALRPGPDRTVDLLRDGSILETVRVGRCTEARIDLCDDRVIFKYAAGFVRRPRLELGAEKKAADQVIKNGKTLSDLKNAVSIVTVVPFDPPRGTHAAALANLGARHPLRLAAYKSAVGIAQMLVVLFALELLFDLLPNLDAPGLPVPDFSLPLLLALTAAVALNVLTTPFEARRIERTNKKKVSVAAAQGTARVW